MSEYDIITILQVGMERTMYIHGIITRYTRGTKYLPKDIYRLIITREICYHALGQNFEGLPRATHCTDRAQTSTTVTAGFELCPLPWRFG